MAVRDNYRINYNIDRCISSDTHNGKNVIQIIKYNLNISLDSAFS